jgi:hypothetical protein
MKYHNTLHQVRCGYGAVVPLLVTICAALPTQNDAHADIQASAHAMRDAFNSTNTVSA